MPISILIVDDTEADARYLQTLLSRMTEWQPTVEICHSADDVDHCLRSFSPDIVFVDYMLGKENGVDIIEAARKTWPGTAFVLQTGNGDENVAAAALRAGAADYLIKDEINAESLGRCLRYVHGQLCMEREIAKHQDHLDQLVRDRTAEVRRLSEAVEQSPFAIQIADIEGRIVYANSAFTAQWSVAPEDVIGMGFDQFFAGLLTAEQLHDIHRAISAGEVWRGQLRDNSASGDESWFRAAVAPVRDADGTITHTVTLVGDISWEIRLQKELQKRSDRLSKALAAEKMFSELQQQFIAMASHEFRTPLAIIDGAAQAMMRRLDGMSPEQITDRLGKIRASVARMTDLLTSTLEMTALDGQQADATPEVCKIRTILRDLVEQITENEPTAEIDLNLDGLPSKISGDSRLISKIFLNLLLNAVRYSLGPPKISVRGDTDGKFITVVVSDSGIGIPADEQPRVFDQFFRASNSSGTGGIGVGLYFAKKLTEMHGGTIAVQSVEGEGATFTVTLPVEATINAGAQQDAGENPENTNNTQANPQEATVDGASLVLGFGLGGKGNGEPSNNGAPDPVGNRGGQVWKM